MQINFPHSGLDLSCLPCTHFGLSCKGQSSQDAALWITHWNVQMMFPGQLAPSKTLPEVARKPQKSLFSPVSSKQIIQPMWLHSSFSSGFLVIWSTWEKLKYLIWVTNSSCPCKGDANCMVFPWLQYDLHGCVQHSLAMPTVWLIGQVGFHHAFLHSELLIITSKP